MDLRLLAAVACAALLAAGCAVEVAAAPPGDLVHALDTSVPAAVPTPPPQAADRAGLQEALDAVAAAFLAKDPERVRPWLDAPDSPFGQRWLQRAANLRDVPLVTYRLELDPSIPDLATDAVRERLGPSAQVVYVVEELALEDFDVDGPAAEDLFLTVVRRDGGWRVAADDDAEGLGLVSVDHLWDHGPVAATRDGPFLALHHPETAGITADLLAEAQAALATLEARWPLPWSRRVPLVVPRDQEELAELLHVTFELDDFIAFATATPSGELGEFRLTGARILVNTGTFLSRPSAVRQRIFAHELLHVATRPVSGPMVPAWVEEGLAQRLGEQQSTTGTDLITALASRGFDGRPPLDAQFTSGGTDRIFLSYQLAWSFADFLAGRYGEQALAAFYEALGRGAVGEPGTEDHHLDRAAMEVFGVDLAALQGAWAEALSG